jgi:hypothetical protein
VSASFPALATIAIGFSALAFGYARAVRFECPIIVTVDAVEQDDQRGAGERDQEGPEEEAATA